MPDKGGLSLCEKRFGRAGSGKRLSFCICAIRVIRGHRAFQAFTRYREDKILVGLTRNRLNRRRSVPVSK